MWTIGREREKSRASQCVKGERQRKLLFGVIDAVHDLKEGCGTSQHFIEVAREAMIEGWARVWEETANWVRQVGNEFPEVLSLWDDLANHPDSSVRWRVACLLYWDIPERQSDRLFATLRFDKSKKVSSYAIDRYEVRPDKDGTLVKQYDASEFPNDRLELAAFTRPRT